MLQFPVKFMQQGYDYELNIGMNESETQKPVFETVNQDFRFLSFGNAKQKDNLRVQLYDKESREPLQDGSVTFYENDKVVDVKNFVGKHEMEIPFPLSPDISYTLQIERAGYIPVLLHDIRFISGMFDVLHLFMSPNGTPGILKKKEYNLQMKNVQIDMSEEVVDVVKADDTKIIYTDNGEKGSGEIYGRIYDEKKEGLDFASIMAYQNNIVKGGSKTDMNGNYKIKPLQSGIYDLKVTYVGYKEKIIKGVKVASSSKVQIEFQLNKKAISGGSKDVVITAYKVKMIDASDPGSRVVTSNSYYSAAAPSYSSPSYNLSESYGASTISIAGGRAFNTIGDLEAVQSEFEISGTDRARRITDAYGAVTFADNNMINDVANNTDISQSRKKFNDVGFWEPNHITDKQGKTSFDIRLPDNITTWKSTMIAMGKHRLHGIDSAETKVYKPLQSMSIIPQFIWDNDKVYAKAKFTNLTKDAKTVTVGISLNDKRLSSKEVSIKNEYVDSVLLTATDLNPIHWKAVLQFEEKYKDEEERDIPVYSSAFRLYTNQHVMMEKDSTYTLQFANGIKGNILLNNTLYENIIAEINELNNYEYGCVEQTASKLKALLCKEKINKAMALKENLTPPIYNLINRLSNYQNTDGTWGWWKRESVNWRMTIYAMDVLRSADAAGYSNSNYSSARSVVNANFYSLSPSDQLYAMYVFQKMNFVDNEMKEAFSKMNINELKTSDKIYYYKVAEFLGQKVEASDLYALALEMNNRLQTPYYEDFFHDPKTAMFTAYFIFANSSIGDEWLNVFKDKLSNGQLEKNLNTYAKANMIEALTSSFEHTGNKPITAQVIINDTLHISTFPYSLPITGTSYKLSHTGGNVFVNTAEEYVVYNPTKSDSLFSISTTFIQQNQSKEILQAGVPCQMKVTVNAYRSSDYVMLEIPIPSGMRVMNKIQPGGCTIEYFKNKIVVFYSKLSMDQHQLTFDMQPNLKGNFTLPAAKCSLMYYPYIFGNNEKRSIEIR